MSPLVLMHPASEVPEDGPFPLGREHLVGQSAFDDVDRSPLAFPELQRVEGCLGEDRNVPIYFDGDAKCSETKVCFPRQG